MSAATPIPHPVSAKRGPDLPLPAVAADNGYVPASNDSCEDGCFFCTGPETD
ncbi:hypothetical protein [Pseudarthrobacter albicanus]|uniref:hypothetical protein n=1 Tax=Pseudarthrobacter albicanus TaxID=2823873 RepID=UPI001BACB7CD|nr:hypothetical protein [Pseudarthrobacter albicanus]